MSIKNNMFAFLDGDDQGLTNLLDPVAEKKKIKEAMEMEKKKQQLVGSKKKPQKQQSSNGSNYGPSTSTAKKPIASKNHQSGNSWNGRTGNGHHQIQRSNNGGYQEKKPPTAPEAKDVTMTLQEYEKKVLLEKKKALDAIITKNVSTKASSSSSSNSPVAKKNNLDDDQDKKKLSSSKMESTRVAEVKKPIAWGGHQDSVAVVTQGQGSRPANHRATNGGYGNIVMRSFAAAATTMTFEDPNQFPSLSASASATARP